VIETVLAISILVNVVFIFYSRWLIGILRAREEDVNVLADNVAQYVGHVKAVHEMEMFYGDQTLKGLIEHGTSLVEKVEEFDFLLNEIEEEEDQ
jgi:hypothetical protein